MSPEMLRCVCGEVHEVKLFLHGRPLLCCPQVPPDDWGTLHSVGRWPDETPKEA